jgi:hypothetical protein
VVNGQQTRFSYRSNYTAECEVIPAKVLEIKIFGKIYKVDGQMPLGEGVKEVNVVKGFEVESVKYVDDLRDEGVIRRVDVGFKGIDVSQMFFNDFECDLVEQTEHLKTPDRDVQAYYTTDGQVNTENGLVKNLTCQFLINEYDKNKYLLKVRLKELSTIYEDEILFLTPPPKVIFVNDLNFEYDYSTVGAVSEQIHFVLLYEGASDLTCNYYVHQSGQRVDVKLIKAKFISKIGGNMLRNDLIENWSELNYT